MKIVKFLKESSLLEKGVHETIEDDGKEQGRFLSVLLGILVSSFLENLAKMRQQRVTDKKQQKLVVELSVAGDGKIRAGQDF